MYYIQRKDKHYLETVDEFETRREAVAMVREYRLSDPYSEFYLSSRPCLDIYMFAKDTKGLE